MENGRIKVSAGKIMVIDPTENGQFATITPTEKGSLIVNGEIKRSKTTVKSSDVIEYTFEDIAAESEIEVSISNDKMQAYITVKYIDGIKCEIADGDYANSLVIEDNIREIKEEARLVTREDVIEALKHKEIEFGIKEDVIDLIIKNREIENVLIAEGKPYKNAIDDEVVFSYENETEKNNDLAAVDYKNINKINSVVEGDTIGVIKRGIEAEQGINVLGKDVKSKKNKRKYIKSGNGCKIMSDNIIATVNGQVSLKNGIVSVHNVYMVPKDVDMSTGNINFKGDIFVPGNVNDGMKVTALNDIRVQGNVFSSDILSKGDITVDGSIINSRIILGGNDIVKEKRLQLLGGFRENIQKIMETMDYLIKNKIIKGEPNLSELIKSLADTKYKDFKKICLELIGVSIKDNDAGSLVIKRIKEKLMPTSMKKITSFDEIEEIIQLVDEEINILKEEKTKFSTLNVNYCQESTLQSSGDIIVNGKGIFSTDLHALGSIIFKAKSAVCRGGVLRANKEIQASTVGSEASAQTVLEVIDKKGIINIDVAYTNTLIIINNRKMLIDKPCKQVKCYLDKKGELVIDKFVL